MFPMIKQSVVSGFTSGRHFCRKTNCDGSCFTLNLLNTGVPAPPPPQPPGSLSTTGSVVEPPLKRRKLEDEETKVNRPEATMARSMGHMVLDVTRMAAFSTAGGVNFLNLLEFFFWKVNTLQAKKCKQDAKTRC